MRITVVPHAHVAADTKQVQQTQISSHSTSRSIRFNTAYHTLTDILPAIPETQDFTHSQPPWSPYGYKAWHPLITHSQHLPTSHISRLPSLLYEDLMRCHASWLATNTLPPRLVADTVDLWRCTPAGRTLESFLAQGQGQWFFRLDRISAKDSPFGGAQAASSLTDVVRVLSSSMRAWNALVDEASAAALEKRDLDIPLAFNPRDESMTGYNEFRVFVPPPAARGKASEVGELRLVAVSQYKWHSPFAHPHGLPVTETAEIVVAGAQRVLDEMREFMRDALAGDMCAALVKHGFTFDVVVRADKSVALVEVNPFGALSGCGACLFHWVRDARVLYGREAEVEVRLSAGEMCVRYCCWGCEVRGKEREGGRCEAGA